MVDTTGGLEFRIPTVEGTVLGKAHLRLLIAIYQQARLGEDAVDLVGLIDIEIACEHHGLPFGNLADALHHQLGALATSDGAHVVHVQIEEEELQAAVLQFKTTPRTDAHAGGIPS